MSEVKHPIIFDLGSSTCKVGFAGEMHPRLLFPSCVGRQKPNTRNMLGKDDYTTILNVGYDALGHNLAISYPFKGKNVQNWEDEVFAIFQYAFEQLRVDPQEYTIVLAISIKSTPAEFAKIIFEKFNAHAIYINFQSKFTLIRSARSTGIVVEIGDSITQILPTIYGYSLMKEKDDCQIEIAGSYITERLQTLLNKNDLSGPNHLEDIKFIKEKKCRVSLNYDEESSNIPEEDFEIKGHKYSIKEPMIDAPEHFLDATKLASRISKSISSSDESSIIQEKLYHNIILSGGTAQLRNLAERLKQDLIDINPQIRDTIQIITLKEPYESVWQGASIFAAPPIFHQFTVTKEEFKMKGISVIEQKFFS